MSAALQSPPPPSMTLAEFLAWDETQPERWEFDGSQPVARTQAMVGGTSAHALITVNLLSALKVRLRGTPCNVYNDSLGIIAAGSLRCPDASVACTAIARDARTAENPVAVFEVLSPSTASIDPITKNAEYRATPSIQRYVMLAQDSIAAVTYERRGADWVGTLVTDPAAVLDFPEIGVSLPLADLYEGVIAAPDPAP